MIALSADWHLNNFPQYATVLGDGTNSRLQDIIDAVFDLAEAAKKGGATHLIQLGDVFHTRKSVENTVLDRACLLFEEISKEFEHIYIVAGNHDESISGDGSLSISALASSNVTIIREACCIDVGATTCGMIPYTEDEAELHRALRLCVRGKVDYLFSHLGVLGGKVGPSDFEVPGKFSPEQLHLKRWKHVFLGHFHKHQDVVDGLTYVGSPLQLGVGERNDGDKGFILLDEKKNETEFVINKKSPRFVIIDAAEYKTAGWRKQDYIKVLHSEEQDIEALKRDINADMPIHSELVRNERETQMRIALSDKSDVDMLKEYVKERPPEALSEDFNSLLIDEGMRFLTAARG